MATTITVQECSRSEYETACTTLPRSEAAPFTQAPFYGAWQEADGKTVVYFTAVAGDKTVAAGLVVKYDAPGGISFFYCPYGPLTSKWSSELLASIREFFRPIAKRTGASFVRLDSDGIATLTDIKLVSNRVAATASLQPRAEWLLDITKPEAELLAGMHKHARYNIRLAERASATFECFAPQSAPFETFYGLMQTTGKRDSFGIMGKDYYQAVLGALTADNGFVAICTIDGKPAAAALFAIYDKQAHYVFAGSSNDFRKIAPPYFVIWQAVLEAKKRGCTTLNFGGITDSVKNKHLEGVTGFKKRFGGYEVTHPNPVDVVYKPFRYTLFSLYKRLR